MLTGLWCLLQPAVALAQTPRDGAQIVVLGEVHDNPAHHIRQAEIIAALRPSAIVLEMVGPDAVAAAGGVDPSDPAALSAALGWAEAGWPDFAIYHPIFTAYPAAVLFGAALPQEDVRRAMSDGAEAVFGPDEIGFYLGPLDPEVQDLREAEQQAAHCDALPDEMLPGMVQAQRLRDAQIARVAVQALDATGGPVVVITGNGHARTDWGVPRALDDARLGLAVWSLGQIEGTVPPPDAPFDLVEMTAAVERADPCAVFEQGN